MSATPLHELNQRYVRLTDRCRSQWTFYQLLQGLYKHLRDTRCPVDIDFQTLFTRLKELGQELAHPDATRTERQITLLAAQLDRNADLLVRVDADVSPSLLRRFFDRLRNQDEKVLLAIIKFYVDAGSDSEDNLDKLDILFTRLVEIPRPDGTSLVRERHEIERIVQPLLAGRPLLPTPPDRLATLLQGAAGLRSEVLACRSFSDLVGGGVLDRFRGFKRALGENLLHPTLLPVVMETTITIKNRFRELWDDEESQLMDDTNRVVELQRILEAHPELLSPELRELLQTFTTVRRRFDLARQEENLRREDMLQLRRTLTLILERYDAAVSKQGLPGSEDAGLFNVDEDTRPTTPPSSPAPARAPDLRTHNLEAELPPDPLLADYMNKIAYALDMVGRDRNPAETAQAKELASLRLEPCEIAAFRRIIDGESPAGTLIGERDRLYLQTAALRVRIDEEAREIDRLKSRDRELLDSALERAAQTLQRAAEMERRFHWFIDDALYRGDTENLDPLHRTRFRLLRAYSGLWLLHNEHGGTPPF
jgi:hypothetical protein